MEVRERMSGVQENGEEEVDIEEPQAKRLKGMGGGGSYGGGGTGVSNTNKIPMNPINRDEQVITITLKSRTNVTLVTFQNGIRTFNYLNYLCPEFWLAYTYGTNGRQVHNEAKLDKLIALNLPYRYNKGKIRVSHLLLQQDNPPPVPNGTAQSHTVLPGYLDIMTDTDGNINENFPIMKNITGGAVTDWATVAAEAAGIGFGILCQQQDALQKEKNPTAANKDEIWEQAGKIEELTPGEIWEKNINFGNWQGNWIKGDENVFNGTANKGVYLLYLDHVLEGPNNIGAVNNSTYFKDRLNRQYAGSGVLYGQSKVSHPMIIFAGPRMKDHDNKAMNQRATFHLEREIEISFLLNKSWNADAGERMAGKYQIQPPRVASILSTLGTGDDAVTGYFKAPYRHFH